MKAVIAIIILCIPNLAQAYTYEKKLIDSNTVHIVRILDNEYRAELVKANKVGSVGRETVSSMAVRSNATIAINAGFFEIGGKTDGNPSGSLVVSGKVYGIKNREQPLVTIKDGVLSVTKATPSKYKSKHVSMVSGIPMLLENGEICTNNNKGQFYTKPHARTAVGIDEEGNVVLVVVEHRYIKGVAQIPANVNKDTLGKGLKILELSKLMRDLGCLNAINLDGGGSSTLWIKGKVVNKTIGDKDESLGVKIERPVSDAIVFRID